MGKLANTSSLSNYPKLRIASYKQVLKQQPNAISGKFEYSYQGKQYAYKIGITATPCHYGGLRHWFICPKCHRRASVLYCAGLLVCRHCIGANYQTQLMQPIDKLFRKVEKIRYRLGWQAGIAHGHGNRPKGMHQTTYARLVAEHDRIADHLLGLELEWLDKLKRQTARGKR